MRMVRERLERERISHAGLFCRYIGALLRMNRDVLIVKRDPRIVPCMRMPPEARKRKREPSILECRALESRGYSSHDASESCNCVRT